MAYQFDPRIIQQILAGIGTSLSAAGAGAPNWGLAGSQAIADTQRQQQADATGRLQMQIQQEALQRQRDQDAQQRQRDAQARTGLSRLLGQPDPNATAKFVGGAGSGASSFQQPAPTTAQPSWLTPDVQSIMSGMDPNDAFAFAAKLATEKPDTSAPTTKDFNEGGNIVTKQWNPSTKSWDALSTAPRWQAPQPPQMPGDYRIWLEDKKAHPEIAAFQTYRGWQTYNPNANQPSKDMTPEEVKTLGLPDGTVAQRAPDNTVKVISSPKEQPADIQEYLYAKDQGFGGGYMDYKASLKGQGLSVTLPDGTVVQQGGSVKPPNESQMQAAQRAQLIQDGVSKLTALYTDPNISPWRLAAADAMAGTALGDTAAAKLRSPEEQKWKAAQASALEGLASAVTGAGVTTQQFERYKAMLPDVNDKDQTVRDAKIQAANDFLNVLLGNAGSAASPVNRNRAEGQQPQGDMAHIPTFTDPNDPALKALQSGSQFYSDDGKGNKILRRVP
jgi:hypothetical protein